MTDAEALGFLESERTVICATIGPRGWPHLMPLWFVLRPDPESGDKRQVWAWTYAASQKVRNLERDPRATLQVEAGGEYQELRGVMLETEAVIHRQASDVAALGREIFLRQASLPPDDRLPDQVVAMIDQQAPKRVGLQFVEQRRSTWDHRKLGGTY